MALPDPISDDFDFPTAPPEFLQLATDTLGNVGDASDGFSAIFDPVANAYPGDNIGSLLLDGHIAELENAANDLGGESDPAFNDDAATAQAWADSNREWLNQFVTFDPNPPEPTLPDPNTDLPPDDGAVTITLQSGQAIQQLPANWVQVADDGTVTWQAGESAPQPIELWLSVDLQDFLLFHGDRSGSDRPDWIVPGHRYYFELRSQGHAIAATVLDTNNDAAIPGDPNSTPITTEVKVSKLDGSVVTSTFITPAVTKPPAGGTAGNPPTSTPSPPATPPSTPPTVPPPTSAAAPPLPSPFPPPPTPSPTAIGQRQTDIRRQLADLETQFQALHAQQATLRASVGPGEFLTLEQNQQDAALLFQMQTITAQVQQLNAELNILENPPK